MLKTGDAIRFIKSSKVPVSFEDIWKKVKKNTISSVGKELPEEVIKSDLYLSLIEDERTIMVGRNMWSLKERCSLDDISLIEKDRLTDELSISLDESDDTKELLLKTVTKKEE